VVSDFLKKVRVREKRTGRENRGSGERGGKRGGEREGR
jgi:hypothetical protein